MDQTTLWPPGIYLRQYLNPHKAPIAHHRDSFFRWLRVGLWGIAHYRTRGDWTGAVGRTVPGSGNTSTFKVYRQFYRHVLDQHAAVLAGASCLGNPLFHKKFDPKDVEAQAGFSCLSFGTGCSPEDEAQRTNVPDATHEPARCGSAAL